MEKIRHSLAHVLAQSVKELFPKAILGMGPAIENGFYYDFLMPNNFSEKDLERIEKRMKEIIKKNINFKKEIVAKNQAKKTFSQEPLKLELINDLKDKITTYQSNSFIDLCSGPHVKNTKEIDSRAFKLTRIAGAYWKGNEKNKMLTRIYGIAFQTEKELKDYLNLLIELEKRDHRKLGQQLDLFCFSDSVGPGLPLYTPKGTMLIELLKKHIESICQQYGFEKVSTPSLAKIDLFETSGHAKKFKQELFHVYSDSGHNLVLKPVQCPHHTQLYSSKIRSYKDLPIRYMESDKQYRAEKSGEVGGLNRVYAITVEDGHCFCQVSQVKEEIKIIINIIKEFYTSLGLWENHKVYLSFRDPKHPEKYIGEEKDWQQCQRILKQINKEMNLKAEIQEGEAALYGPKIDFMFKDALGKEIQIPTVQIDFATAKRFNLFYISESGKKIPPVMVHRAILGSYERFLALLIEHFVGAFPFWLSPVQIMIIPISQKHFKYAEKIQAELKEFRTEINKEQETVSKKIRQAELQKIPFIIVLGDKEIKEKNISIRIRKQKEIKEMKLEEFLNLCKNYQSKQTL